MLKGRQIRTGTVHFALEVAVPKRRAKQLLQACGASAQQHLYLEPVPDDTPVTCGKCVHRPAKSTTQPDPTPEENTMTTTVKRGAGRPAAAANRSRHAQRTPLPSKSAHADRVHGQDVIEKTTRKRRAAVTGSEESPNPTRPARRSRPQAEKAPERARKAVAKRSAATGKAPAKRSAKRTPSATLPEDFPGRKNAMRLLDGDAQEHGWVGSV